MRETPTTIKAFWFGTADDDGAVAQQQSRLWWAKDEATDRDMALRFASYVEAAARHELDDWAASADGRLALILLTDQFPRNIYRDTPQAFAFDGLARAWCKEGLRDGVDRSLRPIERVFFYLPLEHSESLDDQELAVALFERLMAEVAPAHQPVFEGFLDFARRHREVIQRFSRFPHRNRILGRASSDQELAFLQQKGSSF